MIVVLGTPAAWWLSQRDRHPAWQAVVDLPMVLPPAVIGLALLVSMSPDGLLGGASGWVFSTGAVVLAQVVVAAPFYLSAACAAFRRVDVELVWVARSLGLDPVHAFQGHAAACGAWAARRCGDGVGARLGEFGATIFVAGNLPGVSQTMLLAIYTVMESSLPVALSLAMALVVCALAVLGLLRALARAGGCHDLVSDARGGVRFVPSGCHARRCRTFTRADRPERRGQKHAARPARGGLSRRGRAL